MRFHKGSNDLLCTLRFADDVLILASSQKQLKSMLTDLIAAVGRVGLHIHPGKTKIVLNSVARAGYGGAQTSVNIAGNSIEVLPSSGGTKYLGRMLNIDSNNALHDFEIDNRIASAWRKFFASKYELTSPKFPLNYRLRLLDSVVSPWLLYGTGCWTLNEEPKEQIENHSAEGA